MEYARQGYMPEAMVNFLALLGWSPGSGDREVFARDELIAAFDLGGISGGNAVFNTEKLDWFNQQHLWRLPPDEVARRVRPALEAAGLWRDEYGAAKHAWFDAVLQLLKPRAKKIVDFAELGRYFFADEVAYDPAAVTKHLRIEGMRGHLQALDAVFERLASFDVESTERAVRALAGERGVKPAALIHALRVALTGRSASPGLFEVAALLGRQTVRARLAGAVSYLSPD
jgi:glutamyl-tRNA synthetase